MCARLTHTLCAPDVSGVSWFTDATEGALRVQTLTVLTQIPHHLTLVNICATHTFVNTQIRQIS